MVEFHKTLSSKASICAIARPRIFACAGRTNV